MPVPRRCARHASTLRPVGISGGWHDMCEHSCGVVRGPVGGDTYSVVS